MTSRLVSNVPETGDFVLGTPALVCRWRLVRGKLPLANRHLRALGLREIEGIALGRELVAWAKQQIEWSLEHSARDHPDGVLMLIVDEASQAAMTIGPYEELPRTTTRDLLGRAASSKLEAQRTGISPETIWGMRNGLLLWGAPEDARMSGIDSLVADLAKTSGITVSRNPQLQRIVAERAFDMRGLVTDVFLASDEHGVIVPSDATGDVAEHFAKSYAKLLEKEMAKQGG